jgi:hypothetical protein
MEYDFLETVQKNIRFILGDWGLGIGDWGLGPIPNPQSPIPNPQKYKLDFLYIILVLKFTNFRFKIA